MRDRNEGGSSRIVGGVGIALVVAAMIAVAPQPVHAEEMHCMSCSEWPGIPGPSGIELSHIFGPYGSAMFDCHAFNACHTTFSQPGRCEEWHYWCESGPHALLEVRAAVESGSLDTIQLLASAESSLVSIVAGGYVVVHDCDRTSLLGAFTLPTAHREVWGFAVWAHPRAGRSMLFT